jgi:hypothetical protein
MLAIIDYRTSQKAIDNLSKYVKDILLFRSENITYASISGHPDVFIYQDANNLIVAPNSPKELFDFFEKHKIKFEIGYSNVGSNLKNSTLYNCISTDDLFLHIKSFSDKKISEKNIHKHKIYLPQAYTRCSLTHIGNNCFITSDKGIERELLKNNIECLYFSAENIKIFGHKNGFFGGTNGILNNKIFFNGNFHLHKNGKELFQFFEQKQIESICLHNDFLYDGGGMFFV